MQNGSNVPLLPGSMLLTVIGQPDQCLHDLLHQSTQTCTGP